MTSTQELPVITNADIVEAVRAATSEVFSTMLNMEIRVGAPDEPYAVPGPPTYRIVSLIGLAGPWAGTGSLSCTGSFACKMSSQLLMGDREQVDEEILDAVAEITNMVIGNAKTLLEAKVGTMGLSTPTVIFGRDFMTRTAAVHDWTVVPFYVGADQLLVHMCMVPGQKTGRLDLLAGMHIPHLLNM